MPSKLSIVIDADIVRSAGKSEVNRSKRSRELLEKVRNRKMWICMNKKLFEEYRTHRSNYSKVWYNMMRSRRRINWPKEVSDLKTVFEKYLDGDELDRLLKDIHLVELSLECDKIIYSYDDRTRKILIRLTDRIGIIRPIVWQNPIVDSIDWLDDPSNRKARTLQSQNL